MSFHMHLATDHSLENLGHISAFLCYLFYNHCICVFFAMPRCIWQQCICCRCRAGIVPSRGDEFCLLPASFVSFKRRFSSCVIPRLGALVSCQLAPYPFPPLHAVIWNVSVASAPFASSAIISSLSVITVLFLCPYFP